MTLKRLAKVFLLGLLPTLSLSLEAEVVLIVSAKSSLSKISPNRVSQIFLGHTRTFSKGKRAEPLDLPESDPIRDEFYVKFLGKSAAQVKALRANQGFSGRNRPPLTLGSKAELVKKVAENPRYIGYVDKSAVTAEVKILTLK